MAISIAIVATAYDKAVAEYGAEICPTRLFDWAAEYAIELYGGADALPCIHKFMREFDEVYARVMDGERPPTPPTPPEPATSSEPAAQVALPLTDDDWF